MVEGAENTCCAAWKKKHSKLWEKYSKLEGVKNKFRDCTSLVNQQYDVIEKENGSFKQELENLKAQAGRWKDEKGQEYSRRADLESEISILKEEILLLQQNAKAAFNESDRHLQERLDVAEIRINQLKELLEKERCRTNFEKNNADMERKKADEALKKLEAVEEKYRADQLSRELEGCKQRLEELQKRQQIISHRRHVDNPPARENSNISDIAIVKLLKKQKKLEKMLVKHAKEVTKVHVRKNMLHQELFQIKKRFRHFQQRLDMLDDCFVHGDEIIHKSEKANNETSMKEKFYTDGCLRQLVLGIDYRLNPRYRGFYQIMSKSSALNSSKASISDLPLMNSHEIGAFSVTTSANPGEYISNLNPSLSKLSRKGTVRYSENVVANVERSMKCPIKGNPESSRTGHWGKRKILGVVESMEKLYSKGQKLHEQVSKKLSVLHDILGDRKYDPTEQNRLENSCREQARPTKRRKTSCGVAKIIHPLHNSNERKGMIDSDIEDINVGIEASSSGLDVKKYDQCLKDGIDNDLESTKCDHRYLDEMSIHVCMMLLDLDNAAGEKSYLIAITKPLSPTLPEITFLEGVALDTDNADMLVDKKFLEGLCNVKDNLAPTSGFNPFDMEKYRNHFASKNLGVEHVSDACFYQNHVLGGKLGILNVSGSRTEKTHLSWESSIASSPGALRNNFIFSLENKDDRSISRILLAISRCKPQFSLLHSVDVFLQRILLSLEKAEDLSSKEKVCVFFSITMLGISEFETKNLENFLKCDSVRSLDSVTLQICSALSDLVVRGIFMESCDLFDLLALIEDFLLQRKVLVCGDLSSESPVIGSSKMNLVVNGSAIILFEQAASVCQLIVGGCLLASLCLAVDHIGFVCETSCELFGMPNFDPVVVLDILHCFVHLCGSEYFTLQPYSLAMTVIKSLVIFLEKKTSSSCYATSFSSLVETPAKTWSSCTNCPFSKGVASMEGVASLLLENLQKYCKSCSLPKDSLELMNSLVPSMLPNDRTKEVSGLRQAVSLSATSNKSLCNFVDILSLVEIVAHFTSWEWTFGNIIGGLFEILESCAMESFCVAIIVLFSQLGRLGVDSNGYEDIGIKKLRDWLSAFFCRSTSRNLSIPVQFTTALSNHWQDQILELGFRPSKCLRLGVDSNGYEDTGIKKPRDWLVVSFYRSISRPVQITTVTALLGLIPVSFEELLPFEIHSC